MRIIAGRYRGRRLVAPRGLDVRPTSDRARETLLSMLGTRVPGASFLDLFSGTGAVGLESLSRGAARCVFVENAPAALTALRRNIAAVEADDLCRVIAEDVPATLEQLAADGERFDLVFADPPYDTGQDADCLHAVGASAILNPGGLLILEHRRGKKLPAPPPTLEPERERRAGEAVFAFYRRGNP